MKITAKGIVKILLVYTSLFTSIILFLNLFNPNVHERAIVFMGFGLWVIWVCLFGWFSYAKRDLFKKFFSSISLDWKIKFILFSTLFALTEEAVTTTLTNSAPLLGSNTSQAFITASTNYFEVVFLNSVFPIFFPWFIAWTFLLSKYDFKPLHTFLLFGLTGTIAEASFGLSSFVSGYWIFVYGLMIYLPAYALPKRATKPPSVQIYFLALVLPFLLMLPWGLLYSTTVYLFGFEIMSFTP